MLRAKFEVTKITHAATGRDEYIEIVLSPVPDNPQPSKGKGWTIRPRELKVRIDGPVTKEEKVTLFQIVYLDFALAESQGGKYGT